jgi:hypothetical protein
MQNNYYQIDYVKQKLEHEKNKKQKLLNSNFFKILGNN